MQFTLYQTVPATGSAVAKQTSRKNQTSRNGVASFAGQSRSLTITQFDRKSADNAVVHLLSSLDARAGHLQQELRACASSSRRSSAAVGLSVTCSGAGVSDASEEGTGRRSADGFDVNIRIPSTMSLGAFQGVTLEKASLDLSTNAPQFDAQVDDSGGGGNNNNKINNGGGGDGDDGDDDDYFDDGEDGDGDDDGAFTRRSVLPELFDRRTIEAVLQEWFKTLADLPYGIRMAVEMGIVSTAQLWRFLGMDARPTIVRAVSRTFPTAFSRDFIGRMMADPAFLAKLAIDQTLTAAGSLYYEVRHRQDRFFKEFDLVMANTLTLMVANAAVVWTITPNRSFGAVHTYPWQRMLHELPNHIFDSSGPLRNYTHATRGLGALMKAAELSALGMVIGAAGAGMNSAIIRLRQMQDPTFKPTECQQTDMSKNALGMAAWMGLSCAVRYQVLSGLDRLAFDTYTNLGTVLSSTVFMRVLNNRLGEPTRTMWTDLPQTFPEMTPVNFGRPSDEEMMFMRRRRYEEQMAQLNAKNNIVSAPTRRNTDTYDDDEYLDDEMEEIPAPKKSKRFTARR